MIFEAWNVCTVVNGDETKCIGVTSIEWDKQEMKGKVLFWMFVKDNIIPHIRDCKISKETW